jgi:hypothetical protein
MFIAHTISTFQPLFKMCAARRLRFNEELAGKVAELIAGNSAARKF